LRWSLRSSVSGGRCLQDSNGSRVADLLSALRSPLSDEELELICPAVGVVLFSTGDVILTEGDVFEELFIILVGQAKVFRGHRTPDEIVVGVIQPIEVIGEMGALTAQRRSASVVATEMCRALSVSRTVLDEVLLAHPTTCLALLYEAHRRVHQITDTVEFLRRSQR
jgi:CRP-like cAMP-binding protein